MKINFNQPIMTLAKDKPVTKSNSTEPFLLKDAVTEALLIPDEKLSGEEKAKRWLLATRVYANPEGIDLTVEEVAKIKEVVGKGYGPLVVGQAWEMLERGSNDT